MNLIKPETSALDLKVLADEIGLKGKLYIVMKDQLKFVPANAENIIINLANSGEHGTHWVCSFNDNKTKNVYYFDSFGIYPVQEVLDWCKKTKKKYLYYSNEQFQDINHAYCGEWCLYFLYAMQNNIEMDKIFHVIRTWNY